MDGGERAFTWGLEVGALALEESERLSRPEAGQVGPQGWGSEGGGTGEAECIQSSSGFITFIVWALAKDVIRRNGSTNTMGLNTQPPAGTDGETEGQREEGSHPRSQGLCE